MAEHMIPDFLPSRYNSWLEIYLEIRATLNDSPGELNESIMIKLSDLERSKAEVGTGGDNYFSQEWPLSVIKSRAFDDIITMLPPKLDMMNFMVVTRDHFLLSEQPYDSRFQDAWDRLMNFAIIMNNHS